MNLILKGRRRRRTLLAGNRTRSVPAPRSSWGWFGGGGAKLSSPSTPPLEVGTQAWALGGSDPPPPPGPPLGLGGWAPPTPYPPPPLEVVTRAWGVWTPLDARPPPQTVVTRAWGVSGPRAGTGSLGHFRRRVFCTYKVPTVTFPDPHGEKSN